MKLRLVLLSTLLTAAAASAQPRPSQAFTAATTYESCSESWAFACGKISSTGQRYGTAHKRTRCHRYVFQPDGTFTSGWQRGTYKLVGDRVELVTRNDDGTDHESSLVLSADGATLGGMKRL